MKVTLIAFCCSLILTMVTSHAEDFGISQKTFDAGGGHSIFTFRNGALIHEVTEFSSPTTKKRESWVEKFYENSQPIFIRSGFVHLASEYYTGLSFVGVQQGIREGTSYPKRLTVGREAFDMGADGFYHVIKDPQSVQRESILIGAEFSTQALDEERRKYLHQAKPHVLPPALAQSGNGKIAALVKKFGDSPLWNPNNFFYKIDLPATASPSQVWAAYLSGGWDLGLKLYDWNRIITSETVQLVADHVPVDTNGKPKWTPAKTPITAVLIQTYAGEKIFFMQYRKENGWRYSIYDSN